MGDRFWRGFLPGTERVLVTGAEDMAAMRGAMEKEGKGVDVTGASEASSVTKKLEESLGSGEFAPVSM